MSPRRPVLAIVSDAVFPYHHGGKELRYWELARRLSRRAEVHVYTMQWWDGGPVTECDGITFHAISRRMPLYASDRRSMWQAVRFAIACVRLLPRRFDILEADQIPFLQLFVLRAVATLRRRRFVATWHEVWGPAYWREYMGRIGRLAWWVERAAMRMPDEIVAASAQTAERLIDELGPGAPVTVAPNGIDLEVVQRAETASQRTDLVAVGRLLQHKRIDLLLDAMALLHGLGVGVTCCIIGDGPERPALEDQARRLGLETAVEFRHDLAAQADVYSHVKAARVFVFPSSREGFGIAALEALACGLPVVTTSAPDNLSQHLVRRSARSVVCEPTAPALADAILELLRQEEPGGAAADTVEPWLGEYDWDLISRRVAGVLLG
jgi:glycosyltransferase involved in cell wall biosynthesis